MARGDLHLSALCGLAPHLSPRNATELFTACCRKTRRQVDELLAARFPKPDVREQIRRLPVSGRAAATANDPQIPDRTHAREEALAAASVVDQGHQATLVQTAGILEDCGSETAEASAIDSPPPPVSCSPKRHREIEALSADRFGVHFTADGELRGLLERARALASHRLPKNDLPSLMRLVLESFVKNEEARRFAVGRKPRSPKAAAPHANASPARATPPGEAMRGDAALGDAALAIPLAGGKTALVGSPARQVARVAAGFAQLRRRSRCVPAAVRRAVYLRDDARCSFVSHEGRRCDARALLELDHAVPWAKLGDAGVDNIRLRCRAHNQWHARECFGARHIEAKIAARRPATALATDER